MAIVRDRSVFENAYAGKAPWDIGKPQKPFVAAADQISGTLLDCGCGTGDNALYFAERGCQVTGIDFLHEPISRAQRKAAEQKSSARFLIKDALTLKDWQERFDNIIDCGLFHVFNDEDRQRYVAGLGTVLKPNGRLFLMCFSDQEPGVQGPRRVSNLELQQAFGAGWKLESVAPVRFEIRPDMTDLGFSEGGPNAWFVVARRLS